MNVYLAKSMAYFEVHRMHREGHSISKISEFLVLNRRTVSKYLSVNERGYEAFPAEQADRGKKLLPFEDFVRQRLEEFRDTPAARMRDWLKEHYPDFPVVSRKTVFNFVSWIRKRHRWPLVKAERQFEQLGETPYGKRAQVDSGEHNMRTTTGTRAKVFFLCMVLSRSRFEYVWFTDRYFTPELAIGAHEKAFGHIGVSPMRSYMARTRSLWQARTEGILFWPRPSGGIPGHNASIFTFAGKQVHRAREKWRTR